MGKKGLREQLIGAWRLVSYIESPVDGSPKRFPMGEKALGIIMYTPDGYMSAQLMTPEEGTLRQVTGSKARPKRLLKRQVDTLPTLVPSTSMKTANLSRTR